LRKQLGCDEASVHAWCTTWIGSGFDALEALLAADAKRGRFCFGDTPAIADVYLVPQVESARRRSSGTVCFKCRRCLAKPGGTGGCVAGREKLQDHRVLLRLAERAERLCCLRACSKGGGKIRWHRGVAL
jgi:glutathione S-transferase